MTEPSTFLAALKALSDDDFSSALAMDPDLIKKAQKAIVEANRKKAEAQKAKSEAASAQLGTAFDLKAYAKAIKLVKGPYNEGNEAEYKAAIALTDPAVAPDGQPTIIKAAMDYLADRDRVVLDWPMVVYKSGAKMDYPEVLSLCNLFNRRSLGDLGSKGVSLLSETFCLPLPWGQYEKQLLADKVAGIDKGLIEFFRGKVFGGYASQNYSRDPKIWKAFETIAKAGGMEPSKPTDMNPYGGGNGFGWEIMATYIAETPEASEAKSSAFSTFINLGWCDTGSTPLTEHLTPKGPGAKSAHNSRAIYNCGSRSVVRHLPLEQASLDIFIMLCEREAEIGFSRYDEVGRSRLFFVNEKLRDLTRGGEAKSRQLLFAMAQKAIELGDPPESVNSQNPYAKAADAEFAAALASAIEKRELSGVSSPASKLAKQGTRL